MWFVTSNRKEATAVCINNLSIPRTEFFLLRVVCRCQVFRDDKMMLHFFRHMLGKAVTKTMQLTDRNTPLQYIYDEGMRFFFGGKPNYGRFVSHSRFYIFKSLSS